MNKQIQVCVGDKWVETHVDELDISYRIERDRGSWDIPPSVEVHYPRNPIFKCSGVMVDDFEEAELDQILIERNSV